MITFLMLTRVTPSAARSPQALERLEEHVMERINTQCPDVKWQHSYAATGNYDYVDIFAAPNIETATKVAMLTRTYGHAQVEMWPLTEWGRFKELIHELPAVA